MIDISNLSVQFTGSYLFQGVNLKILEQDRIALVGSNGTGKSTFLKILAGKQIPEDGKIQLKKRLKVGYLPQELITHNTESIFNDVKKSIIAIRKIEEDEKHLNEKLNDSSLSEKEHDDIILQLGQLNEEKIKIDYYAVDSKIEKILTGLGFSPNQFTQFTNELSGGWQMRVELAKILIAENDLILLDEPTNHLDIDSLRWLIKFLKSFQGSIILVSHDRYFVNNICSKTLEIFNGNVNFFKGNYNDYLNFKEERNERLQQEYQEQQKKIKQTEQFIERFRYKATKARQVQSRIKQIEKIDRIQLSESENRIQFRFYDTKPSGIIPIKLVDITKSYGNNAVLEKLNFQIERGEKIALLGPNGAGKTTLAKIISQRLQPTSGKIEFGHNTQISFYAQDVIDNLDLSNDIITEIASNDTENTTVQLRSILGAFLFHGEDVYKKISVLSGGEKSRVALAKVLLTKANTIILDEPTNHLDFESKKILQNALIEFKGTLIIVSHDIDFLQPIISKVYEVRNNSIKEYYGGIDYYLRKQEEISEDFEASLKLKTAPSRISRKEEKRLEADKRQREFNATKDIKNELAKIENEIDKLEAKKKELDQEIIKEQIYSNPILAKQNRISHKDTSEKLEELVERWSELTEKLEGILKEFED